MSEIDRDVEAALKPLTDKERAFAIQYALVPHPENAAKEAGYSVKSARTLGHQLIKKHHVRKAVNTLRERNELEAGIDHKDLLRSLKTIMQRCMQAVPCLGPDGEPTGEFRFDAKNALGAADIIARMGGHYAAKKLDVDTAVTFIQHFGADDGDG